MLSMDCCIVVVLLLLVEVDEDCTNNAAEGGRREEFREEEGLWRRHRFYVCMCLYVYVCQPSVSPRQTSFLCEYTRIDIRGNILDIYILYKIKKLAFSKNT